MRKKITHISIFFAISVFLPVLLMGSNTISTYLTGIESHSFLTEHETLTQSQRKQKFQKERLEYIVKVANLNPDERKWLEEELKTYDDERAKIWLQMRSIRQTVKKSDALTDQQYSSYLEDLITLHKKLGEVQESFAKTLIEKYTPKKAYMVYDSMRKYSSKVARNVREE